MFLIKLIEGMEEFLLGGFLAGDKLHVIDEKQVGFPVFVAEFNIFAALNGGNQLIGKLVALDVDNVGIGIGLADTLGDGIQQVGFANAGRAIQKQGVVHLSGRVGNGDTGGVGKSVGGANHKIIKGKLGVEIHGGSGFALGFESGKLLVSKDDQLGIGIENFLQCVLNVIGAAAADDLPAEIRRGIENQMFLIQLHHFSVIKPGGHGHGAQALFHMAQDFCPDVGRRIHGAAPFCS